MNREVFRGKGWLGAVLSLILCFALVFSVAPPTAAEGAEGAETVEGSCDSCQAYPIMRPDRETLWEWIEAYNDAPRAYIDMEGFEVPSRMGSLSLLDHLQYNPVQRNQGSCGNCWAWAGTGCLEVALDVQEGVKNRLSVQYVNSCKSGDYACCGGTLEMFADFYDPPGGKGMCLPWDNTEADWHDISKNCASGSSDVLCASISEDPNYPITSIQETTVVTQTVDQATAIANIKNVLNQNKAVWFGFRLPDNTAWNNFFNFWDNNGESVVYDMDQFCGEDWVSGEGGGHAVLCVGYNDDNPADKYWIMLNSWATGPTNNRPNGLFRIDMDMNYDCSYTYGAQQVPAFECWVLDVTFGDMSGDPDITVDPTSFEVTLPPDTTDDYTLTIGNDGTADLDYDITDEDQGGPTAPAGNGELLLEPASMVLEVPLEGGLVEAEEIGDFESGWQNIMTDDFEGAFPGVWTIWVNPLAANAYWGKDIYRSYSPSYSAFCAKSGTAGVDPPDDYPNNMQAWMIYGPFSLADAADAELNFYGWLDSENTYDYLKWMASIDGSSFYGWGLSGDSGGWESRSFDLTDVYTLGNLCGESDVWIAFIFQSDEINIGEYQGAFIDDVVLRQYVTDGGNNPPNTPSNPSPADHATGVSVDADLSWTGGDPDVGDTVTYDVYLDTTDATTQVSNDQAATTYDPGTLNNNTKYYWKIVATDNQAESTTGPVWDFTTGGADCAWLSESPTSGSVAPAGSGEITVSIDTTGLAAGDYSADIVIANNDPDEDPKTVPVTLHVSAAPPAEPDITVSPTSFEKTLAADTSQGYTLTIANDGEAALSYSISDRETTGGGSGSAPPAAPPSASALGGTNADKLPAPERPDIPPAHQEERVPAQIFEQGDTLEELRDKIEQNGYSFTVDHNWVYDMSPEEKEEFFSRHDSGLPEAIDASDDIGPLARHLGKKLLPSQFDWRNYDGHSYIGSIGNQGSCGSCYAFGACAAAEGTYNWANGLYDENCSDFSESFVIWCLGSLPEYNPHFYGCGGADYSYSELTALTAEGVCTEADFPYQTSCCCGDHWDDPLISFDSWHRIPCSDIDAIKTAIMTYGPVDAAVLTTTAFEAYGGGIYEDTNTTCDGDPCDYTSTNHAIALVGWNDNGDPESNGYWILRNSWGTDWGESGYMRIKYHSAVVACAACYLVYGGGEDCAWLSESPTSGSVEPSNEDNITATIDTTGLAEGDYTAEIVIDNNDPDENPTIVPVTLHVGGGLMEGDVTLGGCVSIADALLIVQYKVGLKTLTADQLKCADTTDEGAVSMADPLHIVQWLVDPEGTSGVLAKPLWESSADNDMLPPQKC